MSFAFRPWVPTISVGSPREVCHAFEAALDELWGKSGAATIEPITFEIVDVRPLPHKASIKAVDTLHDRLIDLLVNQPAAGCHLQPSSRLLFVGNAASLSAREPEWEDKDHRLGPRSIKLDAEFAIRTLQNYGFAHYAHIDLAGDPDERLALIRSALHGFERHYRTPRPTVDMSLIGDHLERLVTSSHDIPMFKSLGIAEFRGEELVDYPNLAVEIGLLYQFGKGDRPQSYNPAEKLNRLLEQGRLTFRETTKHSSYFLFGDILSRLGSWAKRYSEVARQQAATSNHDYVKPADLMSLAEPIAEMSFKLARYDLLRDFGRVIGQGALLRLSRYEAPRFLLIDDDIHRILETGSSSREPAHQLMLDRLHAALMAGWQGRAQVDIVRSAVINVEIDVLCSDHGAQLIDAQEWRAMRDLSGAIVPEPKSGFEQYTAVLVDPESRHDGFGPIRMERLANYLIQRAQPVSATPHTPPRKAVHLPPLVAFSQKESSGYVQQCLNMGASAFVAKHRPYHLLFDLARVLGDGSPRRRETDRASQFRLLRSLKPHVAAKLQRVGGPSYIYGSAPTRRGVFIPDRREDEWIRALPKADLHCHMGTAIHLDAIALLATNTLGHFLNATDDDENGKKRQKELVSRFIQTVILAEELARDKKHAAKRSRIELLAAAAVGVRQKGKLECKPFGLGDAIIAYLCEPNDRCDAAHATALLVAALVSAPLPARADPFARLVSDYLFDLKTLATPPEAPQHALGNMVPHESVDWTDGASLVEFDRDRALRFEIGRAQDHFLGVACRWTGSTTRDDIEALIATPAVDFWKELERQINDRIRRANKVLRAARTAHPRATPDQRKAADDWLNDTAQLAGSSKAGPDGSTPADILRGYVATQQNAEQQGLQFYLRGADLLGSAHLQYPENLWLAALAIAHDNARQNIIYSEVRCETTGYTRAGLGAHDATEMLRHGFNLASLYLAGRPRDDRSEARLPLVRTNILLAAKRHKDEADARAVVALLESYMERRAGLADDSHTRRAYRRLFGNTIPKWWRPCDVVGFDISGDESKKAPWLPKVMEPLARRSTPVTIHAGEAESAKSIWEAVNTLNALRIGHGLRLSEDLALLGYCVREGICMEMCPNSNFYTNGFRPEPEPEELATWTRPEEPRRSLPRYHYPLRQYMREGMEVTIGTDNRYLHPSDEQTLTSEYLTAAKLVGGLTRWEILQIVKAGFKNAFLDKAEVRDLVDSAEEEIYRLISTDNV